MRKMNGKEMIRKICVAAAVTALAGCGDSFVGKYKFDNSAETMTIKSNGTCVDETNGTQIACTWKKLDDGKYQITLSSMLGDVPVVLEEAGKNAYSMRVFGKNVTMRK